ncbi:primosomal protein N' [Nevskia soli]|uniref:primosomal protein N' n=1 Tax=Nevskia soli TaxID=418856 RepID=UPI0004A71D9E|nr:primosomal protein N' [Nevskia soli]
MKLVSVAISVPLRRTFDYALGEIEPGRLLPGVRVRVPFGRREQIGVVLEPPREVGEPEFECRPVTAVLDETPLLDAELLALCRWAADYYHHPLGEVLATALPGPLRHGKAAPSTAAPTLLSLTAAGSVALPDLPARSAALRAVLEKLGEGALSRATLLEAQPKAAAAIRRALERGWIGHVAAAGGAELRILETPPPLTAEQTAALEALRAAPPGYAATLLEGVTGSGKTEIYLQLTADALAAGKQVLVLAPEIGLTPQLAERFERRFGARVASYHSGLSDNERARNWMRARRGEVDVLVGTRSAVFLPLARPGLLIIDEEHDVSYKQQEGLRYAARDLALIRAQRLRIPAVLGSATPALESRHNAAAGRYRHLRLQQRVFTAAGPRIGVIDMRAQPLQHGLSTPVLEGVERHLAGGGQALLFLNRRGYAPALLCHDCGWVAPCPNCDARMTLHRARRRLICHHCGHSVPMPLACPDCGGTELVPVGQGTERVEDSLRLRFPGRRIERFDSDRLGRAGELERLLADVRRGAIDILVGTQVLAKGHDFAGLSFAGVLDVDQALYGSDFRALERMGQLVTQVAGRVGRKGQPGEVLLQTHQPEHPLLRILVQEGYPAFCEALLRERREFGLPPFGYLALLRAEARQEGEALAFLRQARELMPENSGVEALGPAPAGMARRAGYHRAQLLLRGASRSALHRLLERWLAAIETLPAAKRLRWSVDVDPADLF